MYQLAGNKRSEHSFKSSQSESIIKLTWLLSAYNEYVTSTEKMLTISSSRMQHKAIPDVFAYIIKEIYEKENITHAQLAEIFHTTPTNVSNYFKKHGIKARRGTPVNYNAMAPLMRNERHNASNEKPASLKSIAEKFGVSPQTVRHQLTKLDKATGKKTRIQTRKT